MFGAYRNPSSRPRWSRSSKVYNCHWARRWAFHNQVRLIYYYTVARSLSPPPPQAFIASTTRSNFGSKRATNRRPRRTRRRRRNSLAHWLVSTNKSSECRREIEFVFDFKCTTKHTIFKLDIFRNLHSNDLRALVEFLDTVHGTLDDIWRLPSKFPQNRMKDLIDIISEYRLYYK